MNKNEITLPKIENVICPRCRLTWMCKNGEDKFYFCYACSFILFEKQLNNTLTKSDKLGIITKENIRAKMSAFFNNPWVAFSLMALSLILFMWFFLKFAPHLDTSQAKEFPYGR